MYEHIEFEVEGMAPLMMHNGQLADPLNEFAKRIKEISAKKKKTDADYEEMGRLEFLGGLYVDQKGAPCVPGVNIEAMIGGAARKSRQGEAVKAGVISDGEWPVIYEGPKAPQKMWESGKFHDRRGVKLKGTSTVIRTRPIFRQWKLIFSVAFLPTVINRKDLIAMVVAAGQLVGLCEYVPKFGRFEVTRHG